MPLPRSVARFNRVVTNRVLFPLALRLPFFGIVEHTGRKSHRLYRTPINVFRRNGSFLIVLTYGPKTDWVRNVLASGEAVLISRGRKVRLTNPRIVHDERRQMVPRPVRWVGAIGRISDFLVLDVAS